MDARQLHLIMNLLLQLCVIRTYTRILQMRSRLVFGVVLLAGILLSSAMSTPSQLFVARVLVLNPLVMVVFPVAYSQGPLLRRVTRVTLITAGMAIPEMLSSLLFTLLTGRTFPVSLAQASAADVALCGIAAMPSAILTLEAIAACCAHADRAQDASVYLPILVLMASSHLLFVAESLVASKAAGVSPFMPFAALACATLTLAFSLAALAVARGDAKALWQHAVQDALDQQARRHSTEGEALARRSLALHRLRHDLANQVDTAVMLARQGHADEADRHLAALQVRARELAEGPDAHA